MLGFIQASKLVGEGARIIVAVSGGPDSVCLLHVLYNLSSELGINLHVAHLDHGLRGTEAAADAEYVSGMAREFGLPATIEKRDVPAFRSEKHLTLEEASREVRYAFLAMVARQMGAAAVATGHTLDDNVESILMHLVRGSGLRGLRGLQPSMSLETGAGRVTLVRPLLQISREETAEYCRRHGLSPRLDQSNLSLLPLRNRIRQQLIPLLESYNPRIKQAMLRTSGIVTEELAFLDDELNRVWERIARIEPPVITIDKTGLLKLPTALQRHALRRAIEALCGSIEDYEAVHIEDMVAMLHKPAGKALNLPGGIIFAVEYSRYVLSSDAASSSPLPTLAGEHVVSIPGQTWTGEWVVHADFTDFPPEQLQDPDQAYLDLDKMGQRLVMRARRPGDKFQPLGMKDVIKLKDFMINARVPRASRNRVPVFISNGDVVWVGGWRISERFKATTETKRVLHLKLERTR